MIELFLVPKPVFLVPVREHLLFVYAPAPGTEPGPY